MDKSRTSTSVGTWSSIAAHVVAFSFLLFAGHHAWQVRATQVRGGEHIVLYWQGAAYNIRRPARKIAPQKKSSKALTKRSEITAAPESQPAQNWGANGVGGAQTGSADITPAFPIFSPSPHVADRSLLPAVNQNVVVDVNVSAQGEVVEEKLVQGLGNSLDQIILDTVKSWKFHPANSNGSAVASVAELIFPLSPKWTG